VDFDYDKHVFRSAKFRSVVEKAITFLQETPLHTLPVRGRFPGCGVYALYYNGDNELYAKITELNRGAFAQPIYVGKAVPVGWRTARTQLSEASELYARLREHARSIDQGSGLEVAHFRCRFVILGGAETDLVVPVEAELIRRYTPLWNTVVDGFGNHDPGAGRYNQARSEWDVLHPGRPWADRLTGEPPRRDDVIAGVKEFLG